MPIRTATLEDTPAIVTLATRFLSTTSYGRILKISTQQLEALVPYVLEHGVIFLGEHCIVSEAPETEVVGFLAAIEAIDAYSGDRYADEIAWFVNPDARNGSIGPRLLASLHKWAADKRLSFVKMVAPADTPSVADYYKSLGYEPLETAFLKRL